MVTILKSLREYRQEDVTKAINELKNCYEALEAIESVLTIFNRETKYNRNLVESVSNYIKQIEESEGYKSFLSIFRLTYEEKNVSGYPDLKGVIDFMEMKHNPDLPWPLIKRFLYTNEKENEFKQLTEQSAKLIVENEEDYLCEIDISPIQDSVRNEISNGILSPRAREIFDLWLSLKLAETFNEKVSYKHPITNEKVKKEDESQIKDQINKLFISYFKEITKNKNEEKVSPEFLPSNDKLWFDLVNEAQRFKLKLIELKENYRNELNKYNLDNTEFLVVDLLSFIKKNGFDLYSIPPVRKMQTIPGGAGLIKRCNELREGSKKGMEVARAKYSQYLKNNKIRLIDKPFQQNKTSKPETSSLLDE